MNGNLNIVGRKWNNHPQGLANFFPRNTRFGWNVSCSTAATRCLFYREPDLFVSHISNGKVDVINLLTGEIRFMDHHRFSVRYIDSVYNRFIGKMEIGLASWDGTVSLSDYYSLKFRVKLHDSGMGRCPHFSVNPGDASVIAFSYDTDKNIGFRQNVIRVFSIKDGSLFQKIPVPHPHLYSLRCGTTLLNDDSICCVSDNGYLQIFDPSFNLKSEYSFEDSLHNIIRFSDSLILGGSSGNIYLFNFLTRSKIGVQKAHVDHVMCFCHRDDHSFFSSGFDGVVKTWRCESDQMVQLSESNLSDFNHQHFNEIWSMTRIDNKLLVGGLQNEIFVFEILPGSNDLKFIGFLIISDNNQFAFLTADNHRYYSSDPASLIRIKKEETPGSASLDDINSEYTLISNNDLQVLRDVFFPEKYKLIQPGKENRYMLGA